jgi:hypothetical protein
MNENEKSVSVKSEEQHQFAQMVLDTFNSSGLSVAKFCKNEGIPEWKFYFWRRKLAAKNSDNKIIPASCSNKTTPKFVQIAQRLQNDSAMRIELPSGVSIHISNGCDNNLLRETINFLQC